PAYVNIDKGVFLLHARIEYPNGPAIRSALRDGQTLTFDLDARVDRERRFWFSAGIVAVTLRRELSYHAVSQRFVVRDARSGDQESFATLDEALAYLGKVDAWGVIALSVLLARKLYRLVRDYRRHVPGSRLTARTVGIFGSLVIAPLLIVYLSSLEFINRGIDSWFRVEVKEALNDALGLSRAALELRMREHSARTVALAEGLSGAPPAEMQARLDAERRATEAIEIALFGAHGQILAASLESPLESLPSQPSPDLVRQVGERRPYVSLEPRSGGRYLI